MVDESNKRGSARKEMFRVCRYNIEGREYADLSTNVSDHGIFIKNFSPPPIGTGVTLSFKLPEEWGNQPLKISGRVAHVNNDSDPHKRGMGIEFVSVVSDSVPMIEYFVREIFRRQGAGAKDAPETAAGGSAGGSAGASAGASGGSLSYEYRIIKNSEPQK